MIPVIANIIVLVGATIIKFEYCGFEESFKKLNFNNSCMYGAITHLSLADF